MLFERLLNAGDYATRERVPVFAEEGVSYHRPGDIVKEPTTLEFLGLPVDVPPLERDRNRPSWRRSRCSIDVRKACDLPQEARGRPVRSPRFGIACHLLA
jgi:hypothetical protein